MKNKHLFSIIYVMLLVLLFSCSSDEDGSSILVFPNLGSDQVVSNGDLVTISMAASTSGEGDTYTLRYRSGPFDSNGVAVNIISSDGNTYTQQSTVLITNDKNETFSFTPTVNGTYSFELEIISNNGGGNNFDNLEIFVSGAIELTESELNQIGFLVDQNSGLENGSDYVINDVIELTTSLLLDGQVDLGFGPNGGLIINGGSLSTNGNTNIFGTDNNGWKGILIKSGTINIQGSIISGAGHSAFEGHVPASITVESGSVALHSNTFSSSKGITVNILEDGYVDPSVGIRSNSFDAQDVIHCDFFDISDIISNSYVSSDALITVSGEGDTFLNTGSGSFTINAGLANYYFTDGVTLGQRADITLGTDKKLYVEEGTGLYFAGGVAIEGSSSVVKGWEDKNWIGIYVGNTSTASRFSGITIDGAGSTAHALTSVPAALYNNGTITSMSELTINNSQSFGLYVGSFGIVQASHTYHNLSFTNNLSAAIAAPADLVSTMFDSSVPTFSTPEGIEAVRLLDVSSTSMPTVLDDLGDDNYYLTEDGINYSFGSGSLTINEGAHLKFGSNASIYFGTSSSGSVTINGTSGSPVLLEASDATLGWNGVYLGSTSAPSYDFDYVTISDGGANQMTGATEKANLVLRSSTATYDFTNCTFQNSKGYGVVLESFSSFYDFLDVSDNNAFSGNATADIIDKTF